MNYSKHFLSLTLRLLVRTPTTAFPDRLLLLNTYQQRQKSFFKELMYELFKTFFFLALRLLVIISRHSGEHQQRRSRIQFLLKTFQPRFKI